MKHYIELTLLPNSEIPIYFIWEKLYQQLHLALVEVQDDNGQVAIGVSFPGYDGKGYQLGCKLRLFAKTKQELKQLNLGKWLARLTDYVHITSIKDVPDGCGFGLFKRVQPKSSTARLARRKAKREGISVEQAMAKLAGHKEQTSKLPFVHIRSLNSDKRYRLMICYSATYQSNAGTFSTYGLSPTSTVPVF